MGSHPLPDKGKWYNPCGSGKADGTMRKPANKTAWHEELLSSLGKIQKQLNITIQHYDKQMFGRSYKQVRKGVDENQVELKWLPGQGNVFTVYEKPPTPRKVSGKLPGMHTELQKFAIAMEAVVQTSPQDSSLNETYVYLIQLLCEVEDAMVLLQIGVPSSEQRSVMTEQERTPKDDTNRLIRDWGILIKYRDYLLAWRKLLLKVEKWRKRTEVRKQKQKKKKN